MVEATGIEPVTSCMPCKRSPGLSYAPTNRAKFRPTSSGMGRFFPLLGPKDRKNTVNELGCQEANR